MAFKPPSRVSSRVKKFTAHASFGALTTPIVTKLQMKTYFSASFFRTPPPMTVLPQMTQRALSLSGSLYALSLSMSPSLCLSLDPFPRHRSLAVLSLFIFLLSCCM